MSVRKAARRVRARLAGAQAVMRRWLWGGLVAGLGLQLLAGEDPGLSVVNTTGVLLDGFCIVTLIVWWNARHPAPCSCHPGRDEILAKQVERNTAGLERLDRRVTAWAEVAADAAEAVGVPVADAEATAPRGLRIVKQNEAG